VLGWQEVILIFAILLFVFGPTKLPKIAKELGRAMREFNKAGSYITKAVRPSSTGASRSHPDIRILRFLFSSYDDSLII